MLGTWMLHESRKFLKIMPALKVAIPDEQGGKIDYLYLPATELLSASMMCHLIGAVKGLPSSNEHAL